MTVDMLVELLDQVLPDLITKRRQLEQAATDLVVGLAERGYEVAPVRDIVSWFVSQTGYPFDMRTEAPPPEFLRRALVAEWIARDGDGTPETAAFIERTCAEEGGWS